MLKNEIKMCRPRWLHSLTLREDMAKAGAEGSAIGCAKARIIGRNGKLVLVLYCILV